MSRKKLPEMFQAQRSTTVRVPFWVSRVFEIQGNGVVGDSAMVAWVLSHGLKAMEREGRLVPEAAEVVRVVAEYEETVASVKASDLSNAGKTKELEDLAEVFMVRLRGLGGAIC